jgi:hypothetical protein
METFIEPNCRRLGGNLAFLLAPYLQDIDKRLSIGFKMFAYAKVRHSGMLLARLR